MVSLPLGSDIFNAPGAGLNYVHGGSSPQEMIVPVLDVKIERYHVEIRNAEIALVSRVNKITNLITTLDFVQTEAVSSEVKETEYKVFFVAEDGTLISNENAYVANRQQEDAQDRMFRMRFNFKNQKYERSRKYYLVAIDCKTNLEVLRQEVVMDLAFADDFGFRF